MRHEEAEVVAPDVGEIPAGHRERTSRLLGPQVCWWAAAVMSGCAVLAWLAPHLGYNEQRVFNPATAFLLAPLYELGRAVPGMFRRSRSRRSEAALARVVGKFAAGSLVGTALLGSVLLVGGA